MTSGEWLRETPDGVSLSLKVIPRAGATKIAGTREGRLCNISVKGVYVTLSPIPSVGETFRISFNLPDDEKPVESTVEVAWRNTERDRKVLRLPLGCGLHFLDLSPADQERVAAFVEEHRQD